MENFIKEAKDGFGFDQMKSHDFIVNEARMMISLLAYNFTNWLRTLTFPPVAKGIQIQTIRTSPRYRYFTTTLQISLLNPYNYLL